MYVPSKVFFTEGVGRHQEEIASFEMALRDAGIEPYNIVPVSSVLPPGAEIVEPERGVKELREGMVVHAVLARCSTDTDEAIASSLGVARGSGMGYVVERCGRGDVEGTGMKAERVARELLDEADPDSFHVTAEARGQRDVWTTAVAAAVFVE